MGFFENDDEVRRAIELEEADRQQNSGVFIESQFAEIPEEQMEEVERWHREHDPDAQDRAQSAEQCERFAETMDYVPSVFSNRSDRGTAQPFDISTPPNASVRNAEALRIIPRVGSPNSSHVEAVKGVERRTATPYDVMVRLVSTEKLVVSGNAIYWFDGRIYRLLAKEEMERLIVSRCRDAVSAVGVPCFVENVFKFILKEPSVCQREVTPSPDDLVFLDGVLNLRTKEFRAHTPDVFSTSYLEVKYTEGVQASCPRFDQFVQSIAGGDIQLMIRIWEVIGYLLTQDQRGKCFVLLQGPTNSGKSVLGNFIRGCVNPDAVSSLDLHSFSGEFALADLIGKRLCIDLDLPGGAINARAVSLLKKMTGGDLLSTNIKYMPRVNFVNTAKLLFASNHAVFPAIPDEAFQRRIVVVPFRRQLAQHERDLELSEKLAAERAAVVVKALGYYVRLCENGYVFTGGFSANEVVADERVLDDSLFAMIMEGYEEKDGDWTPTQVIVADYESRYGGNIPVNTLSRHLGMVLAEVFPGVKRERRRTERGGNPVWGFQNLSKLRDPVTGESEKKEG